ncbi:MAG TPA: flagellar assembly protein FliW [Candidatus Binatia bacterium]|nr:flagellar assembly protein FliW [Candidatus Binatia bacterium]
MAEPDREGLAAARTIALRSRRFGDYDVPEERIVVFPDGLVGFPEARRFALLEPSRAESPFHYLVCVDYPELGFVVCDPERLWPSYSSEVPRPADVTGEVAVLVLVRIPADPGESTANLMAPLVIDCATRRGRQLVLDTGRWATRHPLFRLAAPDAS